MKISSRFTVAVHTLSLLSINSNTVCTSEWIAGSVNTNPVVIRRIMSMLKKAGLISVTHGKAGATLNRPLEEITLLDVYHAVEVVEEGELFQFHDNPNPSCPVGANIQSVLNVVLLSAQEAMESVLAAVTLKTLTESLSEKIDS